MQKLRPTLISCGLVLAASVTVGASEPPKCNGALLPEIKIEIAPEHADLKPFYQSHLDQLVKLLPGFAVPERVTFRLRAPDTDGSADLMNSVVNAPALFAHLATGKSATREQSLALVIHEFGHIAIHQEVGLHSDNWAYLQERYDHLVNDHANASEAEKPALQAEHRRVWNILNVAFLGYQELFADFLTVVYLNDPQAIYNSKHIHESAPRDNAHYYYRNFDAEYGPGHRDHLANYLSKLVASPKQPPVAHLVFGITRADIWHQVKGKLKTDADKQRALRALMLAISHEMEKLEPEDFSDLAQIGWIQLNDRLTAAFADELARLEMRSDQ